MEGIGMAQRGRRRHISLKTKLAAAICQLFLNHDEAVELSEQQVLSLIAWDHHPIPFSEGGEDVHFNLAAVLRPAHKEKTAKIDIPGIAKRKRVAKAHEGFLDRRAKFERPVKKKGRSFPKGRKLKSRSSFPSQRRTKPNG